MARKLIDQEEAARILGVSADEVGSLRDRKKLFPYRDGDQWKFKQEDVERLRDEMQAEKSDAGVAWMNQDDASTGDSEEIELQMSDDLDSILLSEIELGKSGTEGPSTIIGKGDKAAASEEDDFSIMGADKPNPADSDPGDITLASSSGISFGTGTGSGLDIGGSDLKLSASDSDVAPKPGSSDKLFGSDALKLSDDELSLVAPAKPGDAGKKGAGSKDQGSAVNLGDDDDADSALGASSDVTLSPTDSGIQLISASDSGLSLDQPVELGSSAKKLLELSDDDIISLEDSSGGSGVAIAGEKADDEFLLTAIDESAGDESDSGSQVIALDADDELSSGMFAPVAQESMLEEDTAAAGTPTMAAATPLMGAPGQVAVAPQVYFSTANVLALLGCFILLMLCGMMMYDLMRNMWSWSGPYPVNSSILESLAGMLPGMGR